MEIKGEYHAQTGTIYLYDIHGRHIREKHIFYYYAHECGHKYYHEYIGGNELKNLLTLMSQWPLQEERYSGYRVVRKIEEIFSDVFALFLRMRHYQAKGMKKAEKIRKALDKKAPGGVEFLKKSFKETSKNSNNKPSETYPVTHLDFERIEKIFGSNLL
ncbi:MAG: hypothetical protein Q7T11_08990 [Deltaproteobacteria bacterium]|nr:hypothetical protein [Deltaproteobacteria bacterium]